MVGGGLVRRLLVVALAAVTWMAFSGVEADARSSSRRARAKGGATERRAQTAQATKPERLVRAARAEVRPRVAVVPFTVLPGDTHARLAEDLTGTRDTETALRRLEPRLVPGRTIDVPRPLLLPGLADADREPLPFGRPYPTLWSVARRTKARAPAELGRMARNLQRINGILNPDRIAEGTPILVPRSLLAPPAEDAAACAAEPDLPGAPLPVVPEGPHEEAAAPGSFIRSEYRVADLRGLDRRSTKLPDRLRNFFGPEELAASQSNRGEVDLVVVHTTEHRGGTFENTASYIRRKRLANYLVGPDGAVYEVVPEAYRAYGCGDSLWDGRYIVDLEAINVEIFANTEKGPHQGQISDAQYEGLRRLVDDIRARRPKIDQTRVVTHRMVALNFKLGTRSRKGDPYEFDWGKAGLPDNSHIVDRDMLEGRAKLCSDGRYTDRITTGQIEAAKILKKL